MILDPVPAYVIKTQDVATGEKIFINVCTDSQIEPPATLDASEIAIQVTRGEDWIVPIVVSAGRTEVDKQGQACFAADCCMHPSVVMLGIEDPSVKVLTVETCIELVEDRFQRGLSRDYKFPRMKSKGKLARTEVNEQMPHALEGSKSMDVDSPPPPAPIKNSFVIESVSSEESSPFYFHVYRGAYHEPAYRPSHVVELEGEHHNIRLHDSTISLGAHELDLKMSPQKLKGFYNSSDDTTYIFIWK